MRFLKDINESFGNREQEFTADLVHIDVTGMDGDWSQRDLNVETPDGHIDWRLVINMNKAGIEGFLTSVDRIVLIAEFEDNGETIEFEIEQPEVELDNVTKSFYPSIITIDMNYKQDPKDWDVTVRFGNPN